MMTPSAPPTTTTSNERGPVPGDRIRFLVPAALATAALTILAGCSAALAPGTPSASATSAYEASSAAVSTPGTSTAPTFLASADGLTLTVALDRSAVSTGETVTITASVINDSADPIEYAVPDCGGAAMAHMSVRLPQEPVGKTWTGIAQEFKEYVLREGYGGSDPPPLQPLRVDVTATPCRDGQNEALLQAGEAVSSTLTWPAQIVEGIDALPGDMPFTVSVAYDRQNEPPSYPPDFDGIPGSWAPMYKQLEVRGTIDIIEQRQELAGPGEVLDGLLADATFADWLDDQPRETWSTANLFLAHHDQAAGNVPAGTSWEVDLFREVGVPLQYAIAFVGPFDASLRHVAYCGDPANDEPDVGPRCVRE
jgi:hypothetical protein